jgi:hypothetical protein
MTPLVSQTVIAPISALKRWWRIAPCPDSHPPPRTPPAEALFPRDALAIMPNLGLSRDAT